MSSSAGKPRKRFWRWLANRSEAARRAMRAGRSVFVEAGNALMGSAAGSSPARKCLSIGNASNGRRRNVAVVAGGRGEIRRFYPSRQFFGKNALTIPVFGIASPLGAGWLLLKSMIEDRRLAAKRTQMTRAANEISRQAIAWNRSAETTNSPACPKTASTRRAEYGLDRAKPWLRGPDLN